MCWKACPGMDGRVYYCPIMDAKVLVNPFDLSESRMVNERGQVHQAK